MAEKLKGKRIAFLVANEGVEQVELTEPWKAVEEAGAKPELISPEPGEVQAFNHLDKGDKFHVDKTVDEADESTTTASSCPAASRIPDILRTSERGRVRRAAFFESRQAGRRDLPRPVDARRGGCRA